MRTGDQAGSETLFAAVGAFSAGMVHCRLPLSPRKNDHSSRHFLLRLIGIPAPAHHDWAFALRGLMTGTLPSRILQPLPDGRLRLLCVLLFLLKFLAASAVVDNPLIIS